MYNLPNCPETQNSLLQFFPVISIPLYRKIGFQTSNHDKDFTLDTKKSHDRIVVTLLGNHPIKVILP